MIPEIEQLKSEVAKLKERNQRVEEDKLWETSVARKLLLVLFTYLAVGFYLRSIDIPNPWQNAIVPAGAFLLSTLTMPIFKNIWRKYIRKD